MSSLGTGAAPNIVTAPIIEERDITVLSLTLDPAAIPANSTAEQTFAAPGVVVGDALLSVNPTIALPANVAVVAYRVSAADQIAITFANVGAAASDPQSATFLVSVFRPYKMAAVKSFSG